MTIHWGELLHSYLRHPASPEGFLEELGGPTFGPSPWLEHQPRRPGPADPEELSTENVVRVSLVVRQLTGWSWAEITRKAADEGLETHDKAALSEAHVISLCRRFAEKLGIAPLP